MERTIGIKVADGTFYPVLEDGFYGDKRLVLTTIRDNQAEVHIDFYQGDASVGVAGGRYIGSLIIENIEPAAKGSPDIEVVMGASLEGNLNVSATDRTTGEEQSLSVSLRGPEEQGELEVPDFELEAPPESEEGIPEPEPPAATAAADRAPARARVEAHRAEPARRGRLNPAVLILFVVLGLVVLGAVAYVVYRTLLVPGEPTTEAPAEPAPAAAKPIPAPAAPAASTTPANAAAVKAKEPEPASSASGSERGARYRIKWGDTLWDLSSTYYRDPWLYPRIARANNIKNPDLIFAGTTILIPER